ncbi:DUF2407 C-terminal domain-containing protein [Chytriomyces sp. MP71]|nr:DUF2407 C-terminal domain-containing protein [Chytriomyces sp. MP71]
MDGIGILRVECATRGASGGCQLFAKGANNSRGGLRKGRRMEANARPKQHVVICFADQADLALWLSARVTVSQLKAGLSIRIPGLKNKHLRMLFKGRILLDETCIGSLTNPSSANASLVASHDTQTQNSSIFIHCAVSEFPASSDMQDSQILAPALGFDRLIDIGFSQAEVANLRSQFHSIRGRDEQHDVTRTAEEAWIDNEQRNDNEGDEAVRDPNVEILLGLCFGFFGGIMVLFWIKERDLFTRRQQLGIVVGLLINIFFGLLRFLTTSS